MELKAGIAELNERLTDQDSLDTSRTKSFRKIFLVKLKAAKEVTILLKSVVFDAYLRVEDSAGKELARDDDGGGERNARVVFAPPADGVYRIIATSFDEHAIGKFTLSVGQRQQ